MLEASVPRVHRWARLATAEAEMKTTFLFVTENITALTTGSARAGGIQAFKSDQFAQNQSGLKVTLRTGGCAPGKRRSPLRTPRRSPSLVSRGRGGSDTMALGPWGLGSRFWEVLNRGD